MSSVDPVIELSKAAAKPGFDEQVAAEARATWGPELRRLYWLAWGAELVILFGSALLYAMRHPATGGTPGIADLCFLGFAIAVLVFCVGVPSWLCADLLSTHTPDNPEPHREWPPERFAARVAGRLGPLLPALLLWAVSLSLFSVANTQRTSATGPVFDGRTLWFGTLLAPVLVVPGLFAASLAALFSAAARRPRRGVVTFGAVFLGLGSTVLSVGSGPQYFPEAEPLVSTLAAWGVMLIVTAGFAGLSASVAWNRYHRLPG